MKTTFLFTNTGISFYLNSLASLILGITRIKCWLKRPNLNNQKYVFIVIFFIAIFSSSNKRHQQNNERVFHI